jgi:tripartite-type tricarboxylate transporter receptor subunit TctC
MILPWGRQVAVASAVGLVAVLAGGHAAPAHAQGAANYPNKAIRYLVGYTPGGVADMLARAVGQKLTEAWGQQVLVENRPGGGTNIATEMGARAAPDGYTLFMPTVANAINVSLMSKLNFDVLRDFVHITNYAKVPGIVTVHPSVPARNAKELIAIAKARPGELRHASTGIGSPHHLAAEIFKSLSGVKMIHVPYKGATPAITDTVAGHVEIYFGAMVSTIPHVKSGRLRAIGVTSLKRVAAAGDTPTLDEQGLKGFETGSWFGLSAPAATPNDIVMKLHAAATRAIQAPDIRDRMSAEGAEFLGDTPAQFTAYFKSEIEKWGRAVKASGAKPE